MKQLIVKRVFEVCAVKTHKPHCSLYPTSEWQHGQYVPVQNPDEQPHYLDLANVPDPFEWIVEEQDPYPGLNALIGPNNLTALYQRRFNKKIDPFIKIYYEGIESKQVTGDEVKKYYGDIYASVQVKRLTLVTEENDKVVTFSSYEMDKHRKVGSRYFKIKKRRLSLTYNKKTHNLYISGVLGAKPFVRCNCYSALQVVENELKTVMITNFLKPEYLDESPYSSEECSSAVLNVFNAFLHVINLRPMSEMEINGLKNRFIRNFIEKKGIKNLPKHTSLFLIDKYYPGQTMLKKHKFDLVRAVLHKNNIYNRLYHSMMSKDELGYVFERAKVLWDIFRDISYLRIIGRERIEELMEGWTNQIPEGKKLNPQQKRNLAFLLKEISMHSFMQYWNEVTKLQKFFPEYKFRVPPDVQTFGMETVKLQKIANVVTWDKHIYEYQKEFINIVEQPFNGFFPILLRDSFQFVFEGNSPHFNMKNRESFFISLRRGKRSSNDKVTLWFRFASADSLHVDAEVEHEPPIFITVLTHGKKLDADFQSAIDYLKEIVYNSTNTICLRKPTVSRITYENDTNRGMADI
jgi:hypothetical protein